MKKFADKLTLKYTDFQDLQHLTGEAIQFALDSVGVSHTTEDEAIALAKAFCELQDRESGYGTSQQ